MRKFRGEMLSLAIAASLVASAATGVEQRVAPDARAPASSVALVVFRDVPGSASILRGNYEQGLDRSFAALERAPSRRVLELTANICAAQVKLGQIHAANASCERALATNARAGSDQNRIRAVAVVNHGVVHLVQGDREFAVKEFRRAARMSPSLGVARSNRALAEEPVRQPHVVIGETM